MTYFKTRIEGRRTKWGREGCVEIFIEEKKIITVERKMFHYSNKKIVDPFQIN